LEKSNPKNLGLLLQLKNSPKTTIAHWAKILVTLMVTHLEMLEAEGLNEVENFAKKLN
jgi:hypothetical protein